MLPNGLKIVVSVRSKEYYQLPADESLIDVVLTENSEVKHFSYKTFLCVDSSNHQSHLSGEDFTLDGTHLATKYVKDVVLPADDQYVFHCCPVGEHVTSIVQQNPAPVDDHSETVELLGVECENGDPIDGVSIDGLSVELPDLPDVVPERHVTKMSDTTDYVLQTKNQIVDMKNEMLIFTSNFLEGYQYKNVSKVGHFAHSSDNLQHSKVSTAEYLHIIKPIVSSSSLVNDEYESRHNVGFATSRMGHKEDISSEELVEMPMQCSPLVTIFDTQSSMSFVHKLSLGDGFAEGLHDDTEMSSPLSKIDSSSELDMFRTGTNMCMTDDEKTPYCYSTQSNMKENRNIVDGYFTENDKECFFEEQEPVYCDTKNNNGNVLMHHSNLCSDNKDLSHDPYIHTWKALKQAPFECLHSSTLSNDAVSIKQSIDFSAANEPVSECMTSPESHNLSKYLFPWLQDAQSDLNVGQDDNCEDVCNTVERPLSPSEYTLVSSYDQEQMIQLLDYPFFHQESTDADHDLRNSCLMLGGHHQTQHEDVYICPPSPSLCSMVSSQDHESMSVVLDLGRPALSSHVFCSGNIFLSLIMSFVHDQHLMCIT